MSFSKKMASILYENKTINEDEKEFVEYGLEVFFSSMLEIFSILINSAFVGNFLETLIFFVSFVPLRIYAGGFHADTKLGCFFVSLIVYAAFSIFLFNIDVNAYEGVIISSVLTNTIMVFFKAPIIHKNKNRTDNEIKTYRKIALLISLAECIICLVCFYTNINSSLVLSGSLGIFAVTFSMWMDIMLIQNMNFIFPKMLSLMVEMVCILKKSSCFIF